jgi:transcriptional regulator with XRE-family HTH domain
MLDLAAIATRIANARIAAGMTKAQLAAACERTKSMITRWEKGESAPTLEVMAVVAEVTNTSPEWLAFGAGSAAGSVQVLPVVVFAARDTRTTLGMHYLDSAVLFSEMGVRSTKDIFVLSKVENGIDPYPVGSGFIVDGAADDISSDGHYAVWRDGGASVVSVAFQEGRFDSVLVSSGTGARASSQRIGDIDVIGKVRGIIAPMT